MRTVAVIAPTDCGDALIRECAPHLPGVGWRLTGVGGGPGEAGERAAVLVLIGGDADGLFREWERGGARGGALWAPAAASARLVREVFRRARRLGMALSLSRPWRWDPGFAKVAELVGANLPAPPRRVILTATPAAAGATGAYGTGLAWKLRPHLDLCRWLLGRDKALPEVTLRASPAAILADWGDGQGAEIVLGAAAAGTGVAGLRVEGDGGHVCLSADRSAVEVEVALPGVGARSFLRPVLAGCGTALEIGGLLAAVRCGTALPATPAAEAAREFETLETVAKALRRIRVPDGASS